MLDRYFEDLQPGERWSSRGRTITEADLVLFSAFSGDWNVLHTDAEWARQGPFGQRIAHGLLVLSVSSGLIPMGPGHVVAFYGIDDLRFRAPTFIGDTLHVEIEVKEKRDRGKGRGLVAFAHEVKKQTGEVVCSSTWTVLMRKREEA